MPVREPQTQRDCHDPRVAAALAAVFRGGIGSAAAQPPSEILAACLDGPLEWGGEQTDLGSWLLRAWLAARVPGGGAWYRQALPLLEAAPDGAGVIGGHFYGNPTSRTACALLVLYEGTRTSPTPR